MINHDLGYFVRGLKLIPDHEMRQAIGETRSAASEALGIPAERIFVVCLTSLYEERVHRESLDVDTPVHLEEIHRFEGHIWRYIRENGVPDIIDRAAAEARHALTELAKRLEITRQTLDAFLNGSQETGRVLEQQFAEARRTANELWQAIDRPEVAAAVANNRWPEYKRALDAARDKIVSKVNTTLKAIEQTDGHIKSDQAEKWSRDVEEARVEAYEQLEKSRATLLADVLNYYSLHATAALRSIYDQVPILANIASSNQLKIDGGGMEREALGRMTPGALERLAQFGLIGTAAASGASLGGGGGIAVLVTLLGLAATPALFVGGVIGGGAAMGLWYLFRDSRRDAITRGLTKFREGTRAAMDTAPEGAAQQAWDDLVKSVSIRVGAFLQLQFEQILVILSTPSGVGSTVLGERRRSVLLSLDGIAGLAKELADIQSRAEVIRKDNAATEPDFTVTGSVSMRPREMTS